MTDDDVVKARTKPKFVILEGEAAVNYATDQEFEELCARTNPSPGAREIMRRNFIPSWEREDES